jgi:hypothetical protein
MGPKPQNKQLCEYDIGNGGKCTKLKQYQSADYIHCYCKKHYLSWKNNGGVPQTLDVNQNQPVDITGNNDATGQSSANNSTVNNAAAITQASAPQTMAGICAGDASAGDNEQQSSLATTFVELSLENILANNNDTNANASTRIDKVAFEITTTNHQ